MTLSYDEDSDVLYITFARPKNGVRYLETDKGDILRFCQETNQMVGVTIMYFADRSARRETIEVPEVGVVAFSASMLSLVGGVHGIATH